MTNSPSPTGGQVPLLSPWLAALLILGGCFFGDPVPMGVRNLTGEPVEVYYVGADEDGSDILVFELSGTRSVSIPPTIAVDCTFHPLEARTLDGEVVDRNDDRLCEGDIWEIDGES